LWSALGHATQSGLDFLLPADDALAVEEEATEDARLPNMVAFLLEAYAAAFDCAVTALGWPVDPWHEWKAHVREKLVL
jgi:hypothetical protein